MIDDFDFGLAIMRPTSLLDFAKYFALKASANGISLVGVEDVTVTAENLLVEVNQSSPSVYGVPLFPVVDFAGTFNVDEQQLLFDIIDTNGVGGITQSELAAAFIAPPSIAQPLTTAAALVMMLNAQGAPPGLQYVLDLLKDSFLDTTQAGQQETNRQRINDADADGDGKFDPIGYEVNTGGSPVYLDMDSALIRAQGFLELNFFDTVFLTGSVAFELGPTQTVTLTGTPTTTKEVTTMTIGAADVTAFIGANGPYWTDVNGDHEVSWAFNSGSGDVASRTIQEGSVTINGQTYGENSVLPMNVIGTLQANQVLKFGNVRYGDIDMDGVVDANETVELNEDAIGFHITDLDIGLVLMASTNINDLGAYLAGKISVDSFGLVGIDGLTATGALNVELNVGFGATGFEPDLRVVDFDASFNEMRTIYALIAGDDNILDASELNEALATPYERRQPDHSSAAAHRPQHRRGAPHRRALACRCAWQAFNGLQDREHGRP